MKSAIIIHGMPSKESYYNPESEAQSNKHWLAWLQQQLIIRDVLAQTPEMPTPYEPVYSEWCKVFEQFKVDADTILVGHSCGGGFLVRWLSGNKIKVGKVMLVAPWTDPDQVIPNDFFKFEIDKDLVSRTDGVTIFNSDDDDADIQASVTMLRGAIANIHYVELHNHGHFTMNGMGKREFPELLTEVLR